MSQPSPEGEWRAAPAQLYLKGHSKSFDLVLDSKEFESRENDEEEGRTASQVFAL